MLMRKRTSSGFLATGISYPWLLLMQSGIVALMIPHKRAKQSGWDMANTDVFFNHAFVLKHKNHVWNLNSFPAGGVLCTDDQGEEVLL